MKGETCHQKRIRNGHRRQHILGRIDVKHFRDHPTNVRFLNIRSFLGGGSFCQPCHLIYVHSLATRPKSQRIHQGQSSLRTHGSNIWHQSKEISHRKWNFLQRKVLRATCQITIRQSSIAESERMFKTE